MALKIVVANIHIRAYKEYSDNVPIKIRRLCISHLSSDIKRETINSASDMLILK